MSNATTLAPRGQRAEQLGLFDRPPSRPAPPPRPAHNRTDTSRAAAESIACVVGTLRREVLDFLLGRGDRGATNEEIQLALGRAPNSITPRSNELLAAKLIERNGETRPTQSGRAAHVLVATAKAKRLYGKGAVDGGKA